MINRHVAGRLSALVVAAVLVVCTTVASGQESAEQITRLKNAVVIVTTYDDQGKPLLLGSGFFIEADLVATNFHVIKDASRIQVQTFSGAIAPVLTVVAKDEKSDLALLRLESGSRQSNVLSLKTTATTEGAAVTVISNPQGSHWKVTHGATGLLWEFHGLGERLQISAAILPGSSGGPVLDAGGQVVGIATMYFNSIENLSFAVPVEKLQALQLKALTAQARKAGARVELRVERSGTLGAVAKNSSEPAKRATHLIGN